MPFHPFTVFFHVQVSNPGTTHSPVAMFHKNTNAAMNKSHVLSEFPKPIRVVIHSVAFGLGLNIPDIREVVNYGMPDVAKFLCC